MSITSYALVDSGATCSFIPTELAEILELEKGEELEATGAGGKFEAWRAKITIEILKGSKAIDAYPDMTCLVPKKHDAIPYVVLGRDKIFNNWDITFREARSKIIMRPSSAKD